MQDRNIMKKIPLYKGKIYIPDIWRGKAYTIPKQGSMVCRCTPESQGRKGTLAIVPDIGRSKTGNQFGKGGIRHFVAGAAVEDTYALPFGEFADSGGIDRHTIKVKRGIRRHILAEKARMKEKTHQYASKVTHS